MNKSVALLLLALAGIVLLALVFFLRESAPVQAPPSPSKPVTPIPVTPALPSQRPALPVPQESGDPNLNRWRSAIRLHNQKDVLELQSLFVTRPAEYRDPLMAMARDEAEPRIRAFTIAVLGRMKAPPAESFFVERTGDSHEYPRKSALEALEKLGTKACLETVDRLGSTDPAEAVRVAAAQAAKAVRSR